MLLEHVHTMDELTDEEFGKFVRAYASYIAVSYTHLTLPTKA